LIYDALKAVAYLFSLVLHLTFRVTKTQHSMAREFLLKKFGEVVPNFVNKDAAASCFPVFEMNFYRGITEEMDEGRSLVPFYYYHYFTI
jgi:hypothetical protein